MFIWKLYKSVNKHIDRFVDWIVELTFARPKLGLSLSAGMLVILLLIIFVAASVLNVAVDVMPGEKIGDTFSGIGSKLLPVILGLGLILFAFSKITKRVNTDIEHKSKENDKTNDASS